MNLLEFNFLTLEEKCEMVAVEAKYLSYRYNDNIKVYLYSLEDFFVEISFSSFQHKIMQIEAFNDIDALTPYLDFIRLDELVSIS